MAHIDKEELLDRVDHDQELLTDLVEIFEEDGFEQIQTIKAAIETKDASSLEHAGHSFKGSSRNMAAGQLAAIAEKLEFAGKNNDFANVDELLNSLQEEYRQVLPEMKELL